MLWNHLPTIFGVCFRQTKVQDHFSTIDSYDFSSLYTTLPSKLIKERFSFLINWSFIKSGCSKICCNFYKWPEWQANARWNTADKLKCDGNSSGDISAQLSLTWINCATCSRRLINKISPLFICYTKFHYVDHLVVCQITGKR